MVHRSTAAVLFLILLPAAYSLLSPLLRTGQIFSPDFAAASSAAAMAAFSFAAVLGCRSFRLNQLFGSLSNSYRLHHLLTLVVFVLALAHVLFLTWPLLAADFSAAWDFLHDVGDPLALSGWTALGSLLLAWAFSSAKKLKRRLWRKLHRLTVLAFLVAFWHLGLSLRSGPLGFAQALLVLYAGVAVVVLFLHYFFPAALRHVATYEVVSCTALGPSIAEISLRPIDEELNFFAGQFAFLSIDCKKGCGVSHDFHPFTIASIPGSGELRFAIKALGEDSEKLLHVRPGSRARVEGPYGSLLCGLKPTQAHLWIAGGIGITPFLGLLRQWGSSNVRSDIVLFALAAKESDQVFRLELSDMQNAGIGLKVRFHVEEKEGRFELARELPPDWLEREIFLSGSAAMARHFESALLRLGAKAEKIHTEAFDS